MKEFIVTVKEIHRVRVQAEDAEDAAKMAAADDGEIEGWTTPEVVDVQEQ